MEPQPPDEINGPPSDEEGSEDEGEEGMQDESPPDLSYLVFDEAEDAVCSVSLVVTDKGLAVAAGSVDDHTRLYRVVEGGEEQTSVRQWGPRHETVGAVRLSPDGKLVASGALDGSVVVYGSPLGPLKLPAPSDGEPPSPDADPVEISFLEWHSSGEALLGGASDGTGWLWFVPGGRTMHVFADGNAGITCGAFGAEERAVCFGYADGSASVYSPKSGQRLHRWKRGLPFHTDAVLALDTHRTLPLMVTGSQDHTCRVVDTSDGTVKGTLTGHEDNVEAVGIQPLVASPLIASAGLDGIVNIWDATTLRFLRRMQHRESMEAAGAGVTKLAWHPQGAAVLVTAANDGSLVVWDARSGGVETRLTGHEDAVLSLDVATETGGQMWLATGSEDETTRLWHVEFAGAIFNA